MSTVHLVRRFFGSLRPGGPSASDEAWVRGQLLPGEGSLWARMSGADRRHAVGVARRVSRSLGADASRPVIAAALLHDVGKVVSGLGTGGRVVATVVGGRTPRMAEYRRHDQLGAELLAEAGSDPLTVAWAREHHLPRARWTVPRELGEALKAADDD